VVAGSEGSGALEGSDIDDEGGVLGAVPLGVGGFIVPEPEEALDIIDEVGTCTSAAVNR
jgi:hypothetical protein